MKLAARPVQIAVMTAPTSSLGEALSAARRQQESMVTLISRALGIARLSPRLAGG